MPQFQNFSPETLADGRDVSAHSNLIQAALFDDDLLAHNEPVSRHFSELGKNRVDVFIGIDEGDNDWKATACLNKMSGANSAPALEST